MVLIRIFKKRRPSGKRRVHIIDYSLSTDSRTHSTKTKWRRALLLSICLYNLISILVLWTISSREIAKCLRPSRFIKTNIQMCMRTSMNLFAFSTNHWNSSKFLRFINTFCLKVWNFSASLERSLYNFGFWETLFQSRKRKGSVH